MKTVFKWIGAVFGLAVTLLTILAVNVIWFKPFHISIFYDKAFLLFALDDPEMLTHMGMEPFGMDGYNAEFKDESPAQTRMTSQLLVDNLETLRSYNREKLEGQAALSYDIMEWFMDQQVRGLEFMWHGYPVNQLFGIQNTLPSFMTDSHQIDDVEDAEYYVARLSKWHTKFSQVLEDLNERNEKGIYPPRFVIDQVIQLQNIHITNRYFLIKTFTGPTIMQVRLTAGWQISKRQHFFDFDFRGAIKNRCCHRHTLAEIAG